MSGSSAEANEQFRNGSILFAVVLAQFPYSVLVAPAEFPGLYWCAGYGWGCDSMISTPALWVTQWREEHRKVQTSGLLSTKTVRHSS